MPFRNRVDPCGAIFRSPARGTFMGNRGGALHNDNQQIVREYKGPRWIVCVLDFRGRRRKVMSPGLYTELFFLDESVALAAGHRPCAECRRERFNAFKQAWLARFGERVSKPLLATDIDAELHRSRINAQGTKSTYRATLGPLPDGCFVEIDGLPYLVWGESLLLWTPEGYAKKVARPNSSIVTVLTPKPTVECLDQGYRPAVHDSALTF